MHKSLNHYAVIALLVLGQCLTVVHAAEFGSGSHEHEGTVCHAAFGGDDEAKGLLQSNSYSYPTIGEISCLIPGPSSAAISSALDFRPPPTGPPLNNQ
ncbi:MAG: hypothetical protein AAF542_03965 [Pseudomonadota bacterium]